jgi:small basic protein (TIGR04137 family)
MSIHPSLKIDSAGAQQRTVLTRIERIKDLMKKGLWPEDRKVIGLPKTKILKIKARKAPKVAAEGEAAPGAAAGTEGAKATAAPTTKSKA